MRVTQIIATFAPIGLVAAGPLHGHSRHTHLHHLHHRSVNSTLSNSTTTDSANSTIYADHISYETSTVNVAANFADGTDANSASSEVASSTISEAASSTTAQSETASSTLSFTSDGSYASGSPSNTSLALTISTAIPSDASISVVLAVAATTPTAVGALSQTVDTTTSISVDTVYNTVTGANGAVTTASASEKTVTVTDVVTNYVTATFSALAPFKAPAIKVAALSSASSCAAVKTSIVYLPASQSPTLVAGGAVSSKVSSVSSKATSQTTVRYVSQSALKSSSSSLKKSSTSSKKSSTSSKKTSTTSKKTSTTSKKPSSTSTKLSTPAVISLATKKVSTTSKKTSTSSQKTTVSSAKKVTSTVSTKKATTSSTKKATTSSSKKATTLISMSSLVQKGATTKSIATTSSVASYLPSSVYQTPSSAKSSSKSAASSSKASSSKASASTCAAVAPPASTQTGIVSGCTKWYTAKSGDYCYAIATANGISTDTFMSWNPAVNAPSCNNIQIGYAYCVAAGCSSSTPSSAAKSSVATTKSSTQASSAATTQSQTSAAGTSAPSSTAIASTAYKMYSGNGTVAAGWPSQSSWVDFETMFTANIPIMQQSCANNGWGANNSPTEIADIKSSILKVSASSGVDARFILAIVMQESNGCVRVVTTSWSVANPGLMQDHAGSGTCNSGGVIQNPCPASEIEQMIVDGTTGTASGDGLVQCLSQAAASDVSQYYRAARIYNGGYSGFHANDLGTGCCTLCYASDVANRLTGWSSGASQCHL
ncbi:hypothetical protein E4T52_04816 [Aureobasidium sp. EXF-3400]|nr:hypothetical protein E4T51_03955 [Aureobasidium sp. EXF-12344]KAI4780266.1 hypothetical protein E4T52_04816 [Aureobasidium sp. EXF-3400]